MSAERPLASAAVSQRRLVICGSMTFYGLMFRIRDQLLRTGVEVVLPDCEDHLMADMPAGQFAEVRRAFAMNHIRRVRNPRTYGVLVLNFDKHRIKDYIGPSTFAEIAIAAAHGKKLFIMNDLPDVYAEELSLWRAQPLHGRLEALISLYRETCTRPIRQFDMFAA